QAEQMADAGRQDVTVAFEVVAFAGETSQCPRNVQGDRWLLGNNQRFVHAFPVAAGPPRLARMIRGEFRAVQVDPPGHSFPSYEAWRVFLAGSTLSLAALLAAAGLVCLVAANWPGMDKWQRLGLAQGVLALLAGLAAWRERAAVAAAGPGASGAEAPGHA